MPLALAYPEQGTLVVHATGGEEFATGRQGTRVHPRGRQDNCIDPLVLAGIPHDLKKVLGFLALMLSKTNHRALLGAADNAT